MFRATIVFSAQLSEDSKPIYLICKVCVSVCVCVVLRALHFDKGMKARKKRGKKFRFVFTIHLV